MDLVDAEDRGPGDSLDKRSAVRFANRNLPIAIHEGRPKYRHECRNLPRPCVHHECAWNTTTWTSPRMQAVDGNCVLDVVERGGVSLDEIALAVGSSREMIRRLEERALRKLRRFALLRHL